MRDPAGYIAAILTEEWNLPGQTFRSFISDVKDIGLIQGFRKVIGAINWSQLLVS